MNTLTPQEYADRHKRAFREAFNFLNAHFPPHEETEWWDRAAKDLQDMDIEDQHNPLLIELICAVYNYIGQEAKMKEEQKGETVTV